MMDTGQVEFGYFVNNIHIGDDFVTIDCSFYVMGCRKEDVIKFPTFLLDSEEPFQDAKDFKFGKNKIKEKETHYSDLFSGVEVHIIDGSCYIKCVDLVNIIKYINNLQ